MCFTFPTLFDNTDKCRVLEIFVENPEDVMSLYHVQEMSGVESGADAYKYINNLIDYGIIYIYGTDGNIKIYKLNIDNPKAKMLIMLERTMVVDRMNKLLGGYYCD